MLDVLSIDIPVGVLAGAVIIVVLLIAAAVIQVMRRHRAERAADFLRAERDAIGASIREAVITYDLDRRLIALNPAFERLTGYTADDIRDHEFLQHIHPDDRAPLLAEWSRLAAGVALADQEYRIVTRTGQVRWTSAAWRPIHDRAGQQIGYLATEFDITERKLAETELLQDTELFQAVLDVQRSIAATGLDSDRVVQVIAEQSQRLTGASGIVIDLVAAASPASSIRLGVTDAAASVLTVELKDSGRTLGTLQALSPAPDAFTPRDTKALRLLSGFIGAALSHAAAYQARQHRLEERSQSLHDSEQRFKQLVDVAQEGIWVADTDGIITYANLRMAKMLGYGNGALLGKHLGDLVEPASRPLALRLLADAAKGPTERQDLRFAPHDGSALWALVSASPLTGRDGATAGTLGFVTDITERKRTESSLRRSAERLKILHDMDHAILAAQSPAEVGRAALGRLRRIVPYQHGTIVLFGERDDEGRLLAGYTDPTIGTATGRLDSFGAAAHGTRGATQYISDLHTVIDPPPLFAKLREEGLRTVLTVPLLVDAAPIGAITLASPTPDAFDAEHREVTLEIAAPLVIAIQQARLREDMLRQTAELEQRLAERNATQRAVAAELDTVLHAVAHDLRPPIRHMGGFAHLLLEETDRAGEPTIQHYATQMKASATRMATLVEDILRLSRVTRHDLMRRPVDLGALTEEIVGQLDCRLEGRSVSWQIDPLPVVDADPLLARLAITELLANAVKFTSVRDHAVISIRPVQRDDQPGIAIQDNGVGFQMAHAGKLFGVFQRLHPADVFDGNGTGLALVQRVTRRHGGHVWTEAEEDAGATFSLTFGPRTTAT